MKISFKYYNRISVYEYDEGDKTPRRQYLVGRDTPEDDDEFRMTPYSPDFEKFPEYVELFKKNRELFSAILAEESYVSSELLIYAERDLVSIHAMRETMRSVLDGKVGDPAELFSSMQNIGTIIDEFKNLYMNTFEKNKDHD